MGLFDALRQQVQNLGDALQTNLNRQEKKKRTREDLHHAPAHRSDLKAVMFAWIDSCVETYEDRLARHLVSVIRDASSFTDPRAPNAANFLAVLAVQPNPANAPSVRTMDVAMCALFAPPLKAAVGKIIDEMPYPAPEGLPLAERRKAIAELDREIAELEAEERELMQIAGANRIAL